MAHRRDLPPNQLLREARERLLSPSGSGRAMSRQELAEAVNQYLWDTHRIRENLHADDIGKLERGEHRWPGAYRREALRTILHADTDAELGLYINRQPAFHTRHPEADLPPRTGSGAFAIDQRHPLHSMDGPGNGWRKSEVFAPVNPTPIPGKLSKVDVEQVRLAAATFMSWDNTYGGGVAREAAHAQLRWSAKLLRAECPGKLRSELFAAVAELGGVAGFMAFDAYAHDDARRVFHFSLECAEESGDWHLRASILSMLARQAIWCDLADDGLTYAETALVRSDRLTATERASVHTLRARALAKLRRPQETLAAVGVADEAFAQADPAEDPPWMAFYDHAQHQGDTGHALWDVAVRGQRTQAAERLAYSITHHGEEYARSRTISRTKLSSLLMVTGDPHQAAAIGGEAVAGISSLRSRRAIDDLWELHRLAARHPKVRDVVELRGQIAEKLWAA